jgi:septal ring factor EnvC (AmiA/AmiB activator)
VEDSKQAELREQEERVNQLTAQLDQSKADLDQSKADLDQSQAALAIATQETESLRWQAAASAENLREEHQRQVS